MALPLCGAKSRAGTPCKNAGNGANGRCKFHGGKSPGAPKANTNKVTHGFYSDALKDDERELYGRAEIGSIDDEIKLAKVKLHRFVQRAGDAKLADLVDGAVEAAEKFGVDLKGQSFDKTEIKAAAPDYADLIIRQLDVIRKLELARSQMRLLEKRLEQDEPDGDMPDGFEVVEYEENVEAP